MISSPGTLSKRAKPLQNLAFNFENKLAEWTYATLGLGNTNLHPLAGTVSENCKVWAPLQVANLENRRKCPKGLYGRGKR